ncbi:hypothetical protein BDK92_6218 [Micromonospora pisi]|uniref:Uncharacterized protein n=1 Tax=Micromonospora pisi TaxID=589240 RepID=A0A495JTV9_9ACTN|nr:hypothetical protein BDK92_6218 [Micromonospora pisi]
MAGEEQRGGLPGDNGPSNAGRGGTAGRDDSAYLRPDLPPVIARLRGNQGHSRMVGAEHQKPASGRNAPMPTSATDAKQAADLDRELKELRARARSIARELAVLARRGRELRRQVEAHQKRRSV